MVEGLTRSLVWRAGAFSTTHAVRQRFLVGNGGEMTPKRVERKQKQIVAEGHHYHHRNNSTVKTVAELSKRLRNIYSVHALFLLPC